MGLPGGLEPFGVSLKNVTNLTKRCRKKSAAFEAAGFLWRLIIEHTKGKTEHFARCEGLAKHLHDGAPPDADLLLFISNNFVSECVRFSKFFEAGFVVVFEGNFPFKTLQGGSVRANRGAAFAAGKWKESLCVPDCLVRMILEQLARNNIAFIVSPGEADAQLAYLQVGQLHLLAAPPLVSFPCLWQTGRPRRLSCVMYPLCF